MGGPGRQDSGLSQVKVKGRAVTALNAGWVDQFLLLEKVGHHPDFSLWAPRITDLSCSQGQSTFQNHHAHKGTTCAPCHSPLSHGTKDTGQAEYHPQIT